MKTNKNLKEKGSKNKRITCVCVTTGVVIIGVMSCVIVKQQYDINKNKADIKLLKEVMHGNVIHSLRETYKRKLRYAEGRLSSGIADNVMSIKDMQLRKEEIEFFSKQLENLDAAEALLGT